MMGVSEFWNSIDAWLVEQKNGGSWTDSKTKEEDESKTLSMCIICSSSSLESDVIIPSKTGFEIEGWRMGSRMDSLFAKLSSALLKETLGWAARIGWTTWAWSSNTEVKSPDIDWYVDDDSSKFCKGKSGWIIKLV